MTPYAETIACRGCGSRHLEPVLNLGTPVLSDFPRPWDPDPPLVPLEMVVCDACEWVQLRHTTDPDLLYVKSYWYQSGINEVMRAELADVVQKAVLMVGGIGKPDRVVDIGANDGTLLANYGRQAERIAWEPAVTLNEALRPHADYVVPSLFPVDFDVIGRARMIKIVTSIAVFNHVDQLHPFLAGIDYLLADDGVWVMQVQDLAQQVTCTAYDNICHEHVTYPSLETVDRLLQHYDLQIAAVERRAINGGSLRFYIRRRKADAWPETVRDARAQEKWLDREALARMAWRIAGHKAQLVGTIEHFLQRGDAIDLYACSTKSSTLLQHCGLNHRQIRYGVERTPVKWGRMTSGTRIPIISEAEWRLDPAPVLLIGAWQFAQMFRSREAEFLYRGGRMLVPLPQTELVEYRKAV